MKKLLYTFIAFGLFGATLFSQDAKNVRFGLFVRGTPSWYSVKTSPYYQGNGTRFGTGFGVNAEVRISDVASFVTGLAGDFDGGNIAYTNNGVAGFNSANGGHTTGYILDNNASLVQTKDNSATSIPAGSKSYILNSRTLKTTYVTIPLLLKLMTKEISGFKYFGIIGGNIGILAKATANDNVYDITTNVNNTNTLTNTGVNVYKDCNIVRFGLNAGIGAEYRMAGTTSLFASVNFVNSFISALKSTSNFNVTGYDNTNNRYLSAGQGANANGIQINIGILF